MRASRLRSIVAASAVAAGAVIGTLGLTAPPAGAMPRSEMQSGCRDAGGTFGTNYMYGPDGTRWFLNHYCTYVDYYGQRSTDFYDRNYNYEMTCDGGPRSGASPSSCYS